MSVSLMKPMRSSVSSSAPEAIGEPLPGVASPAPPHAAAVVRTPSSASVDDAERKVKISVLEGSSRTRCVSEGKARAPDAARVLALQPTRKHPAGTRSYAVGHPLVRTHGRPTVSYVRVGSP